MSVFEPINDQLLFTKNDPTDPRLGDLFKKISFNESLDYALIGYPDDEGIQLNGGRVGAALAPNKIREFFYKMTPPSELNALQNKIYGDLGNLAVKQMNLGQRHQVALGELKSLYQKSVFPITLGGGHDYGFPDAAAFIEAHLTSVHKPVVINFDAHLDVRPSDKGFNSGTPFFRLLNEYKGKFELVEIGIQSQCNSIYHQKWALDRGVQIFNLAWLNQNNQLRGLWTQPLFQKLHSSTPVFISFDIDALQASDAGGCSQAWATGLQLQDCLHFLNTLSQRSLVKGMGIYEVSPPLDQDNRTSRSAALLIYNQLFRSL